ncbi:MAG: NADP-dependent oxidoreductase [Prolixibacteraceae bacterium]|jgi:NADPH:quinone reductase-like Zn-dependent oxidoreductase
MPEDIVMKAIQMDGYGGNEVIKLVDIPKPELSKGQLLVEVYAAAVNPVDWKIRVGMLKQYMPVNFPMTVGGDFSGKVVAIGEGVSEFKMGDSVYGYANIGRGGTGAFAEFAAVDAAVVGKKPGQISYNEAAALPITGIRAWLVIMKYLQIKANQKILIHGGAGGLGIFAIQLAKHIGAYIATTCGLEDVEFVKSIGANEVMDYRKISFEEHLHDYDAVFDTVGGETFIKSLKVLRKGGAIASMLTRPDNQLIEQYDVRFIEQPMEIDRESFSELSRLIGEGKVRVYIDRIFPFEQAAEALSSQQNEHIRGKIVLTINKVMASSK